MAVRFASPVSDTTEGSLCTGAIPTKTKAKTDFIYMSGMNEPTAKQFQLLINCLRAHNAS